MVFWLSRSYLGAGAKKSQIWVLGICAKGICDKTVLVGLVKILTRVQCAVNQQVRRRLKNAKNGQQPLSSQMPRRSEGRRRFATIFLKRKLIESTGYRNTARSEYNFKGIE